MTTRTLKSVSTIVSAAQRTVAIGALLLSSVSAPAAAQSVPARPNAVMVTGTIDVTHPKQRLLGFGAATAYYTDWIARHQYKREIYNALFRGLNLSILRLQNTYRPENTLGFAADDADIVRGAQESLGHPISVLITSWSPPAALKSNGSEKNGGTLARENGAFVYGKFAQYWIDSLAAYRKVGIVPTYISLQNEPDYLAAWESCLFQPTESVVKDVSYAGYDKALDAVSQALKDMPDRPMLIGPETIGIGYGDVGKYVPPDNAGERKELGAIAHHLYHGGKETDPDSFIPAMHEIASAYPDQLKMETEFGRGNGFQTAWIIHNSLVEENANAYLYWSALWPDHETLIRMDDTRKPQSTWHYPHGWQYTETYWAIKHYSYFTAPGWSRVDTRTNSRIVKLSAFLSPDRRRLTAVLLNTSPTRSLPVHLSGLGGMDLGMATVYRTTQSAPWQELGALPTNHTVVLPPESIVTVAWR